MGPKWGPGADEPVAQPPHAVLHELPVTAIKAKGWLHHYLERQKEGLTGHPALIEMTEQVVDNTLQITNEKRGIGWLTFEEMLQYDLTERFSVEHGFNYMYKLQTPVLNYIYTGDELMKVYATNAFKMLDKYHMAIDGTPSPSEMMQGKDPRVSHESRGPNAILFSFGSPGGIIGFGTKRANFGTTRGHLKLTTGSEIYLRQLIGANNSNNDAWWVFVDNTNSLYNYRDLVRADWPNEPGALPDGSTLTFFNGGREMALEPDGILEVNVLGNHRLGVLHKKNEYVIEEVQVREQAFIDGVLPRPDLVGNSRNKDCRRHYITDPPSSERGLQRYDQRRGPGFRDQALASR